MAWPLSSAWFESAKPFAVGECAFGTLPLFCLRIARQRFGALVGGARCKPACRGGRVVPGIRHGRPVGEALVVGKRDDSKVIASIVASATIPAGLAQSVGVA